MHYLWTILLTLFALTSWSQEIDLNMFKDLKARSIGPAGMSGRVTTIDVNLQNPDIIYIGTASGGVWKSESGGIDWEPIFDKEATLSIGAIAINQQNPSEIWVGTGEGNPRNSQNSGGGIYKSLDGGKTWVMMGLEGTKVIHRIYIHRDNPEIVYVGAQGSQWGPSKDRGVYRTFNGGETWEHVLYKGEEIGIADMVVDPSNPNKIIAAMWEFGRKPYTFNSGGKGSGIYISHDAGTTWKRITDKDGLPKGILGRIGLAIAPSKPNIVYALVEAKKNGLYKSTDGGNKWTKIADKNIGNRPFYYADIFVDPNNENRIFNLHSTVTKSEDGGKTFESLLPFYSHSGVHPDHHAFWIHPENPNYIIEGNDGGLNISRDGGDTWDFVDNLPLAQFYHINYDMAVPYNVCGGMQDNGSWIGPSQVWKRGGIKNEDWQEVYFGDGFDVVIRPDDTRYGYAMSQGGNVGYFDKETGYVRSVKPVHPDENIKLRFNWDAAIAQNPFHNCGVYYGSQFVHKSMDCGESWEVISPDLTTNDPEKQKQGESGGLTIDATRAENFTTIIAIAPSPHDEDVIWVGTDDGNLQLTKDGGKTWTNFADKLVGCPKGSWIPQIEVSSINKGEVFVVVNNYRRNDWKPYCYHTKDYGVTWNRIANPRSIDGFVRSIVQDLEAPNLLFLGTEVGLYVSFNYGKNWQRWDNDLPHAPISDLKIHPREHDLIIGTFGRAAYVLDDIRPLRAIAQNNSVLNQELAVFPAPDAYQAIYRSIDGARFIADGVFVGDNKRSGALLTFYAKKEEKKEMQAPTATVKQKKKKNKRQDAEMPAPVEKKEEKKKKGDKIHIHVINSQGDTIRHFTTKIDSTGLHRIRWDMSQKGIRYPSYREPKKDADEPSGAWVKPGNYKLVFSLNDAKDSTMVQVKSDPRLPYSEADFDKRMDQIKSFENMIAKTTEAFNQLKDAQKTVDLVKKNFVNLPDSTQTQLNDRTKIVSDSIKAMIESVLVPQDYKGINREYPALSYEFWGASSFIYSSEAELTPNGRHALNHLKSKIGTFINQVNGFMGTEWKDYQNEIEAIEFPLFKEIEQVKLE